MFTKEEVGAILVSVLVLGFAISLIKSFYDFVYVSFAVFAVILVNILAKKIAGFYFGSSIESRIWEVERFGFKPHHHFRKPLPAGLLFPIIFSVLSFGYVVWMAPLVFDIKAKVYKAARRYGIYTFSEISEWHIGLIAVAGIVANLFFAIIGYLIGFEDFARLNVYFAFFNMLPFSDLDGNKILFGSETLWSFLASIVFIATLIAVFTI